MSQLERFDCEQGTPEWFECRRGIPTASEFATVLAKGRDGKSPSITRRTYMLKLIGEVLTGESAESYSNEHMERGKLMEAEARDLYALQLDGELEQVGFLRRGRCGASPDSLVGADGLLEIKTKLPHLQLGVLLDGVLPSEHVAQVQGQLWVSGRKWVDFVSYWPRLPLFKIRVQRDEAYIAKLAEEVDKFLAEMDALHARFSEPLRAAA